MIEKKSSSGPEEGHVGESSKMEVVGIDESSSLPLEEHLVGTDPGLLPLTSCGGTQSLSNKSSNSSLCNQPSARAVNLKREKDEWLATNYTNNSEVTLSQNEENINGLPGKRSASNESYHSSDEVADEEDLLAVSDSDFLDSDFPVVLGMACTTNTSDVDSAFEDSHYSGSSDDKNRNKGNFIIGKSGKHHGIKNKNRRRAGSGRQSGALSEKNLNCNSESCQPKIQTRCENIEEIVTGNEEDALVGKSVRILSANSDNIFDRIEYNTLHEVNELEGLRSTQDALFLGASDAMTSVICPEDDEDQDFQQLNEPEPALFDLEISPANFPQTQIMVGDVELGEEVLVDFEKYERDYSKADVKRRNRKSHISGRHVHYPSNSFDSTEVKVGIDIEEGQSHFEAEQFILDDDDDDDDEDNPEHPETILLPPLEIQQLQLISSLDSSIQFSHNEDPINDNDQLIDANKLKPDALVEGAVNSKESGGTGSEGYDKTRRISGESKKNELEDNNEYDVVYVVPDGGWGWMVLFGSIIVNILIPGTVKSFGILFVEFIEVFDASPAAAAWIPALSYWLYSSMGPFASALAIKYSHRSVTIVGGLLASFGLMLSYFATSIPYLYVSYGIIGGLGAGLAYPIGVFMVGQYFEKRRGLANGLCTSGSALGSVVVPPLLRVLLVEYGYRGAILIMGGILLNVCVGAMFYDPVSKHMKKQLMPREKTESSEQKPEEKCDMPSPKSSTTVKRRITSPIPSNVQAPIREVAASMPIAIPLPPQNVTDFRDLQSRRGSSSGRRATFQIGHEDNDSWSYRSNDVASPLAARLVKEDQGVGPNSPNKWGFFYPGGIRVRGHMPTGIESNPELEVLIHSSSTGMMTTPVGTALSLSGLGTSRGQSRLNLTAIPEDDDTSSENASRQIDWTYYSALPAAKQRLLRLSVSGGTQLTGSHNTQHHVVTMTSQTGLSRTMSVASNVSNSSFHYMSTIHHGSLLSAMQLDKNIPEFASTLTLKSVRVSCCPRTSTVKGFLRKLTCGLWPKEKIDEHDHDNFNSNYGENITPKVSTGKSDRLKKFIDLSLLRDGMYLIMLASNSTTAIGYTNFIVLLPSYALALGFDKSEAAYLLSIVAALDFVGRIGGAALSDLHFISRKWFFVIGLFCSGLALSFLPYARDYSSVAIMCAAFGLASGTYIGVTAVILADQLGAEKLGSSYGISLFINGLLQLIGPPICGAIFQSIGKLEPILTGLGITLILGALMWIFAPFIERQRRLKANAMGLEVTTDNMKQPESVDPSAQNVVQNPRRSETSVV